MANINHEIEARNDPKIIKFLKSFGLLIKLTIQHKIKNKNNGVFKSIKSNGKKSFILYSLKIDLILK